MKGFIYFMLMVMSMAFAILNITIGIVGNKPVEMSILGTLWIMAFILFTIKLKRS